MLSEPEFTGFPSIARLSRDCVISEKIDGTNAQICIGEDGSIRAGSRTRWITPEADNFGFAAWVQGNRETLLKLGPGRHFGEWWGQGIQRGYGLKEKRFSLFNVVRWVRHGETPQQIPTQDPRILKMQEVLPEGVGLVPELYRGVFDTDQADHCLNVLKAGGSRSAPGFMDPEGIVIFHLAGNVGFKKTIGGDGHKGAK